MIDPEILHLSSVRGSPLSVRGGERIGHVEDFIVWLNSAAHPPISGLVAKIGGREFFVPIAIVADIRPGHIELASETLHFGRFERRPGELLLVRDLAARHLINLQGARLIKANDIEFARVDGSWQVVGVDPSGRGALRRLLPRQLAKRIPPRTIVDWESIEPFVAHVPTARIRIPYRKLSRLHPAQIADLVEAASHEEGEEIIEAVGMDRELEADVFEELDLEHQREFIASRSDEDAARLLATMEPDDAADLLVDLDQERRKPLLEALPPIEQAKVRALLSYNPESAGGLMNPEFLALASDITASEALEWVRTSEVAPESLAMVYLVDPERHLVGSVSVVRILQADRDVLVSSLAEGDPVTIRSDADLHEIVRKMSDFNLSSVPVVDSDHRVIGVVTVDDVLELMIPSGWRRDFGMSSAEA